MSNRSIISVILPSAISDSIWVVAIQRELELLEVCEEKPTRTIKVGPPLFIIELPMRCGAHGSLISLLPYYQAEKFEENESFLKLMPTNVSEWTELWEPVVKEFPEISIKKMPDKNRITPEEFKSKLSLVGRTSLNWKENMSTMIVWSTILGSLLIILGEIIWWIKR